MMRVPRTRRREELVYLGSILLCLALAKEAVFGLDPHRAVTQYVLDVWRKENGLPHNSIRSILQTRDGYIWLATMNGLVRFDGYRCTVFNNRNTEAIRNNSMLALAEDPEGVLWAGCADGRLYRYQDGAFTASEVGPTLLTDSINALWCGRDGALWIGTYGGGVKRILDGTVTTYSSQNGLSNDVVYAIREDRQGSIWIGTDGGGLNRLQDGRFIVYTTKDGLPRDSVYAIEEDKDGALWLGTWGGGVSRYKDGRFKTYDARSGLASNFAWALTKDRDGNLWVGTWGAGLCRMTEDGTFTTLTKKDGLCSNIIAAVYQDRDGRVWAGTAGGLNRLSSGPFMTISAVEGLSDDNVLALCEDRSRNTWVGTQRGLNRIKNGQISSYSTRDGLSSDSIASLGEDRQGNLWIGTSDGGLNRYSHDRFTRVFPQYPELAHAIWSVYADRHDVLWVGTGYGLCRIAGGDFRIYTRKDGLPNDRVLATLEDRAGNLWIGTDGGGLARLKDKVFTPFSPEIDPPLAFISTFYEDQEGNLWIGTWGSGLVRMREEEFAACTSRNGLAEENVMQIVEDDVGNMWMRGLESIFRVSKKELDDFFAGRRRTVHSTTYGRVHGMKSGDYDGGGAQPAAWRGSDGRLWFATNEGVTVVNPRELEAELPSPQVHIEEVLADGALLGSGPTSELLVQPGMRRLEFRYTGLSPASPYALEFRYRLDGFDQEWVEAGTRRFALYTGLRPGAYTFRVTARDSSGGWSDTGAAATINFFPYFYQTRWFYALCTVCVIVVIAALHRWRFRHLRARQKELAAEIESALSQVKTLRGMLPICASCKRIRDDAGYWNQIDVYVRDHSEAVFSHGICPECMKTLYPDVKISKEG